MLDRTFYFEKANIKTVKVNIIYSEMFLLFFNNIVCVVSNVQMMTLTIIFKHFVSEIKNELKIGVQRT